MGSTTSAHYPGHSSPAKLVLTEAQFLARVSNNPKMKPRFVKGVSERFAYPKAPTKDDPEEKHAEFSVLKERYQNDWNAEMLKYVDGHDSAFYLALQPSWSCKTGHLVSLEVLCRVANGKDDAPMPGLSTFQADATQKPIALRFLRKQIGFAVQVCRQFPTIRVSVNVRPDELEGVKDFLIEKSAELTEDNSVSNLVVEITEYAPIGEEVKQLIREMCKEGVVLALDDVTQVQENPGKAMASPSKHACSFELAKEMADVFAIQKLALPMSCSVFRKEVFPTPQYDGGVAQPFLKGMIFPTDQIDEINLRKGLVESWISDVRKIKPEVEFVIECSVYREDLKPPELFPQVDLFDGFFHIQGGRSGGRAFPLDAFLPPTYDKDVGGERDT